MKSKEYGDEENKKETTEDFGHVIDALHNKSKLSSLRTYQGDMAEFIKEKNESVISVVVKEKVREEKREEQQNTVYPKSDKNSFQMNLTMLTLSLFLIIGGGTTIFYVYKFISREPPKQIIVATDIIPYKNIITLTNITNKNLGLELAKLPPSTGVDILKITGSDGLPISKIEEFFDFLEIPTTLTLRRSVKDDFVIGLVSNDGKNSPFVIIKVNDFGRAFASILDWEKDILNDLNFLSTIADTSDSDIFNWKDVIIKNKDIRAFIDNKGFAKIAYTFLDKNTILITNNILVISDISAIYASRAVVR